MVSFEFDPEEDVNRAGAGHMPLRRAVRAVMATPQEERGFVVLYREPGKEPACFEAEQVEQLAALPEFQETNAPAQALEAEPGMTDERKVVPLRAEAGGHFEYVTLAHIKDGTWCVCVRWSLAEPLHCYSLREAAALAHDARSSKDNELAGELAQALNDVARLTEAT